MLAYLFSSYIYIYIYIFFFKMPAYFYHFSASFLKDACIFHHIIYCLGDFLDA